MKYAIVLILICWFSSCRKYVEVSNAPGTWLPGQVFENEQLAKQAAAGMYVALREIYFNTGSPTIITGLSSDEFTTYNHNSHFEEFNNNNVRETNLVLPWSQQYKTIYQANAVLEGVGQSTALTQSLKDQLSAEARVVRAWCYISLVNLFGDVPLLINTDVKKNALAKRESSSIVYDSIVADLQLAEQLIAEHSASTTINRQTVTALLSRVRLYTGQWELAEEAASKVINSGRYRLTIDPDSISVPENAEAIWQISSQGSGGNLESYMFLSSPGQGISCSESFLNCFEEGDKRRDKWLKGFFISGQWFYSPLKYEYFQNNNEENYSLIRLAELYFIRGEARARQLKVPLALDDLNVVRQRAGLSPIEGLPSVDSCIQLFLAERRVELFAETGHRWIDLKRTGTINTVLTKEKGNRWDARDALYPLPLIDVQRNPNLVQNPIAGN